MSTLVHIRGLSRTGFRLVDSNGDYTKISSRGTAAVDLDNRKTQLVLAGERDNFITVGADGATTATIVGTDRRGFRIKNTDGDFVMVKVGSGVATVNLADYKICRQLRRNYSQWVATDSAFSVEVRGIQSEQNGFNLKTDATNTITGSNAANATNGKTVEVGDVTYTFKTNLTEARATVTLDGSATTNVADGDTVTIHDVTYRFKTTMAQANDIQISGSGNTDGSLGSLVHAINQDGTVGTDYFTGTVAPTGVTAGAVTSHNVALTAAVGSGAAANSWASTETSANLAFSAATFTGGVDPVANEVHIGASADATLTNLVSAINASGGTAGTDYSSNTIANPKASAAGPTSHVITITEHGDDVGKLTITTNEPTYTVATATAGALALVYRLETATVDPTDAYNFKQLRRFFKRYIEVL